MELRGGGGGVCCINRVARIVLPSALLEILEKVIGDYGLGTAERETGVGDSEPCLLD